MGYHADASLEHLLSSGRVGHVGGGDKFSMPSYTMRNPYKEVGHARRWGSWQGRAVGDGELEPFGSVMASR